MAVCRCGKSFAPKQGGSPQRYCGVECRDAARLDRQRRGPASAECCVCGCIYDKSALSRAKHDFCSLACRNRFNYENAAGPKAQRACDVCGKKFESRYKRARFCGDACYERDVRKRLRVKGRGLDVATLDRMVEDSKGACAICRRPFDTTPHLDHCHRSSKPRGILCRSCNSGLGLFGDDIDRLYAAIEYLKQFQEKVA
jgi:hypothetical protein